MQFISIDKETPPDCQVVLVHAKEPRRVSREWGDIYFTAYLHHLDMTWYSNFPCVGARMLFTSSDFDRIKVIGWKEL